MFCFILQMISHQTTGCKVYCTIKNITTYHQADFCHAVFMIKTGARVNKLSFADESSLLIRETYDLGGLQIRSISMPWDPYLMLTDCESNGRECNNDGYLIGTVHM